MFKKIFSLFIYLIGASYYKWRSFYRKLNYFTLPNLFTKTKYQFGSMPRFQQKTFFTGKGKITVGKTCGFGYKMGGFHYKGSIEFQTRHPKALIEIGDRVFTNNNIFICAVKQIKIGSFTRIGQNVCIMDFEAHGTHPDQRSQMGGIGEVQIGENVWIGNNVTILKNSIIGENTIIATGAVVNGAFPANVIIGGIPAKIIKEL